MRHHPCVKRESSKLHFVGGFISAEFQLPEEVPFSSVSELNGPVLITRGEAFSCE